MATIDESLRRVPPQSLEAEEAVLGGILLDNAALDRVTELVQADDFYREAHRKVFRAMLDLSARNEPADLITLAEVLKARSELAADAEIVLSDGSVRTIEEIVRSRSGRLLTLTDRWKFAMVSPAAFVDDGLKPVFEVRTRLGRKVRTTVTHPFLTIEGWRPLAEVRPGDHVAVPRRIDVFGERSIGVERAKLLGYLLGDGTLTGACPRFTNSDPRLRAEFREAVGRVGGLTAREDVADGRAPCLRVSAVRSAIAAGRVAFGRIVKQSLAASGTSARQLAGELDVTPAWITPWCQGRTVPGRAVFDGLCAALDLRAQDIAPAGPASIRKTARNGLTRWLTSPGLWGKTAREKFVPDLVFTLVADEVACVLNRLFATDGLATGLASRHE